MPKHQAIDPSEALARAEAHSEAMGVERGDKIRHKDGFFAAQRGQWQAQACFFLEKGDLAGFQQCCEKGLAIDENIESESGAVMYLL